MCVCVSVVSKTLTRPWFIWIILIQLIHFHLSHFQNKCANRSYAMRAMRTGVMYIYIISNHLTLSTRRGAYTLKRLNCSMLYYKLCHMAHTLYYNSNISWTDWYFVYTLNQSDEKVVCMHSVPHIELLYIRFLFFLRAIFLFENFAFCEVKTQSK